ncbi:RNA pseudouridine synthase 7-like isoform X2 [Rhodamnia argentea]|uniref:RNA pseudouridine synthase 7-like isoform X2 n=1 Tax=Rhodamnia argentea TaxID=178133 RepID=A0ABM3HPA2_9MYRT|nr:RNA pseudouridine synthase 7-like isoform X2 [Rhodamnia argentea]
MKRKRKEAGGGVIEEGEIVWQTPLNPPERQDYIFHQGRRYVTPYHFEFISHAKSRWAGKTIVDLFAHEFKGRPYEYYVGAVECGRIQVEGRVVPVSYIVKPSEKISHFVHRHEPPVMSHGVSILQMEPDVVTVCKPASIPVHPCGQYRKNTVVSILQAEHGLAPLFPVHRLDRLVSGLLIFARNALKADLFRQQLEVNVNINYNAREGRSTAEEVSICSKPCDTALLKGKAACTKFTRISTNGTHSIVLCEPVTGRTHQIRVHLQFSGHPIANDMLYLSEQRTNRSAEGMVADKAVCLSPESSVSDTWQNKKGDEPCVEFSTDPMCTNCPNLAPKGSVFFLFPILDVMGMRRHCGCTAYDILDPDGSMSAHIQIGHPLASLRTFQIFIWRLSSKFA